MLLLNKVIYIWELIPSPVDSGRPPSLDYSQLYFILFQQTVVDSGGTTMWQYVTFLESGQVCWILVEKVGECKVLVGEGKPMDLQYGKTLEIQVLFPFFYFL